MSCFQFYDATNEYIIIHYDKMVIDDESRPLANQSLAGAKANRPTGDWRDGNSMF